MWTATAFEKSCIKTTSAQSFVILGGSLLKLFMICTCMLYMFDVCQNTCYGCMVCMIVLKYEYSN